MPDKVVYTNSGSGMGTLFLVFLVLKLTSVINWSWWWVTAPLWGPFAIIFGMLAVAFVFAAFVFIVTETYKAFKKG